MHAPLVFCNNNQTQFMPQKHLGIILDTWLSFGKYLEAVYLVLCKRNKTIAALSVSCRVSYSDQLWSLSIKLLFFPTLIMVIFVMISPECIVSTEIRISSMQCLFSYCWSNVLRSKLLRSEKWKCERTLPAETAKQNW